MLESANERLVVVRAMKREKNGTREEDAVDPMMDRRTAHQEDFRRIEKPQVGEE